MKGEKTMSTICKKCNAEIIFLKTKNNKFQPVDFKPEIKETDIFDSKIHISHFATCPFADSFRKNKEKRQ